MALALLPYLGPVLVAAVPMYHNMVLYNSDSVDWGLLVLFLRYYVERRHQQYAALEAQEALEANV